MSLPGRVPAAQPAGVIYAGAMDRRGELESWIAETRRTQRRLGAGVAIGAVLALALMLWRPAVGGVLFAVVAIVGLCGFWVTSSHIADWRGKLDTVDRPPRTVGRRS